MFYNSCDTDLLEFFASKADLEQGLQRERIISKLANSGDEENDILRLCRNMTHALKNVSRGGKLMPEGLIFDGYLTVKNLDSIDTETPLEDLSRRSSAKAEHDAAVAAESTASEEKNQQQKDTLATGEKRQQQQGHYS